MEYVSTRGGASHLSSKEAVLKGLSDDGGLFVSPDMLRTHIDMESLMDMSYQEMACHVLKALMDDYSDEELRTIVSSSYEGKFESADICPVTRLGDYFLLELYHGPTAAFKDVALCMLPRLMSPALNGKKVMILTATSGDTGKAALEGFKGCEDIAISVFYPHGGVSDIQYLQMATEDGPNTFAAGVDGNFDDCQREVKRLFSSLKEEAQTLYHTSLSSANSINIGRLVPQIVYYIFAYREVLKSGALSYGEKLDYVVPTGNFGDILAGYYALLLGLPVGRLVLASNNNKVLCDFMSTGVYDAKREFYRTISPSMDILISSNLERLLYYASGCDQKYVAGLMKELKETGRFKVPDEVLGFIRKVFDFGSASDDETREYIRRAYIDEGRLIDPHTAVAYKVASERDSSAPAVILSTASPYKFAGDVYKAISDDGEELDGFSYMDKLSLMTHVPVPAALSMLRDKPIVQDRVLKRDEMGDYVMANLKRIYG